MTSTQSQTRARVQDGAEFLCPTCGTDVAYRYTSAGVRYLANLSQRYDNGARYSRGAHRDTCAAAAARREEERAFNAAADAARRRMVIAHRWMTVWGDDLRAFQAADPTGHAEHMTAMATRIIEGR